MLLLTVVAAMGAMARVYLAEQRQRLGAIVGWTVPAIFWTALAAGILLKGPLIVMFVGARGRSRWSSSTARCAGSPRCSRLPGSSGSRFWCCPGSSPSSAAPATLLRRVGRPGSARPRSSSGQEAHGAPPGYYFVLFWLTFWPGATLAAHGGAGGLGGAARDGRASSCSPGSCRPGSCSSSWSPSCRTTCCRSIRRSRS